MNVFEYLLPLFCASFFLSSSIFTRNSSIIRLWRASSLSAVDLSASPSKVINCSLCLFNNKWRSLMKPSGSKISNYRSYQINRLRSPSVVHFIIVVVVQPPSFRYFILLNKTYPFRCFEDDCWAVSCPVAAAASKILSLNSTIILYYMLLDHV